MKYLEFPTKKEWNKIVSISPFRKINFYTFDDFLLNNNSKSSFIKNVEIRELTIQLKHRLHDVLKTFVMLNFYFNKGIPDDEWKISQGKNGESVQFFPNFIEKHFYWKDQFDFYSDIFYLKVFSVFDNIGHILNVIYDLNLESRIYFKTVVEKIKTKDKIFYEKLEKVKNDSVFKKASEIRNDITHNYLPNSVGFIVHKTKISISVAIKKYVRSKEIIDNIEKIIELLKKTMILILESKDFIQ